ncbi:conserved hypothetical protein [Histoplasma capsulatum var. duboisii H88]|uniref:Uncharacterized protein n=2 Tax=Ajellomyces capsulatus TaxID=5037 RepID=F0UU31_AJEC8|nr:conserved hypothetical protein [Histoplasma capsulatum H143]EGC49408.1 conserved hypothetical protein [Histoplasma capsulatum var. duboisii H88]QSS57760.1 hypothetical protein I7I53_12041 [Histoplasma capsulatum var. duboisii H88]
MKHTKGTTCPQQGGKGRSHSHSHRLISCLALPYTGRKVSFQSPGCIDPLQPFHRASIATPKRGLLPRWKAPEPLRQRGTVLSHGRPANQRRRNRPQRPARNCHSRTGRGRGRGARARSRLARAVGSV